MQWLSFQTHQNGHYGITQPGPYLAIGHYLAGIGVAVVLGLQAVEDSQHTTSAVSTFPPELAYSVHS